MKKKDEFESWWHALKFQECKKKDLMSNMKTAAFRRDFIIIILLILSFGECVHGLLFDLSFGHHGWI